MAVRIYTAVINFGDGKEPLVEHVVCDGVGADVVLLSGSVAAAVARLFGDRIERTADADELDDLLAAGAVETVFEFDVSAELGDPDIEVIAAQFSEEQSLGGEVYLGVGSSGRAVTAAHHHRIDADRELSSVLSSGPK